MNTPVRQLSADEIAAGAHRDAIGGLWNEIGKLQFDFMVRQGLRPDHKLIDVGCGCLRGGLRFIPYLHPGNYYGIDINASLIAAGRKEVIAAGFADPQMHLMVNDRFEFGRFNAVFDYGLAQSVFTHLTLNHIVYCLTQIRHTLAPHGHFYATYFEAPHAAHLKTIEQPDGFRTEYIGADSYHYAFKEMTAAARWAGMAVERVANWDHPRAQQMLCFTHPSDTAARE